MLLLWIVMWIISVWCSSIKKDVAKNFQLYSQSKAFDSLFWQGHLYNTSLLFQSFDRIKWSFIIYYKLCTSTTVFKYLKRIAPSYLNDMFMPSLDNYSTISQMALDIPLCRTNKRKKSKNSCNHIFFHAPFEKRNS